MEEIKSPHTRRVLEDLTQTAVAQDAFGYDKYGKYLDPMDGYDWLKMAGEELADLAKYMHAERERRDHVLTRVLATVGLLEKHVAAKEKPDLTVLAGMEVIRRDILRLSHALEGEQKPGDKAGKR